jgi:hypothetical protein
MKDLHLTVLAILVLAAVDHTENPGLARGHPHPSAGMPFATITIPTATNVVVKELHLRGTHMAGRDHILLCLEIECLLEHSLLPVLVLVETDIQFVSVHPWAEAAIATMLNRYPLNQI